MAGKHLSTIEELRCTINDLLDKASEEDREVKWTVQQYHLSKMDNNPQEFNININIGERAK